MSTGTGVNVSKVNAYAVLAKPVATNISKFNAYAVLTKPVAVNVSKVNAYAVILAALGPVWHSFSFVAGVVGASYTQSWDLTPAASPTTYSLASGSLPPGLSLSSPSGDVGTLSGTPTTAGTYTFTLTATNVYGAVDQSFTMTVITAASINPVPAGTQLDSGVTGVPYSQTVSVQGGVPPYTFAVTSGSLPGGLSLNTSTGVISGTPTTVSVSTFTITVMDTNGNTGSVSFTIAVTAPAAVAYGWVS